MNHKLILPPRFPLPTISNCLKRNDQFMYAERLRIICIPVRIRYPTVTVYTQYSLSDPFWIFKNPFWISKDHTYIFMFPSVLYHKDMKY